MHYSMKILAIGFLALGIFPGAARAETVGEAIDSYLEVSHEDIFAQAAF